MFCPHCGNETEQVIAIAPVADTVDREVEIARINAERDIEVAKIAARQDRDWNETRVEVAEVEAAAEVASAEATAEVIAAVIEGDAAPDPEPIIIDAPIVNDDQDDTEELPPAEGSPAPEPQRKNTGIGFW